MTIFTDWLRPDQSISSRGQSVPAKALQGHWRRNSNTNCRSFLPSLLTRRLLAVIKGIILTSVDSSRLQLKQGRDKGSDKLTSKQSLIATYRIFCTSSPKKRPSSWRWELWESHHLLTRVSPCRKSGGVRDKLVAGLTIRSFSGTHSYHRHT